jgi:hypothetical protein
MHWCMDETLAVLALLPIIGFLFRKIHNWYHNTFHHKCHHQGCEEQHLVHVAHDHGPEPEAAPAELWNSITPEYVEGRFGGCIMDDLIGDHRLLKVEERPEDEEFTWFVNDKQELKAVFRDREFIHGYNQCEHGWDEVTHDTGSCCQGLG